MITISLEEIGEEAASKRPATKLGRVTIARNLNSGVLDF